MEKKADQQEKNMSEDMQKILSYVAGILQAEGLISADERIHMAEVLHDRS